MNPIRKFVSSFVTVTTVLWSMGGALLFPSVAQAATLSPGDLIKASGPAVYYYASDGQRYVFPNEKTYFSWYTDFSSVKTITDAELAAIMIGGNVTIRPGTKLVKITTDPKTYAVSNRCGLLHWIESESLAQELYGDDWNQQIVDVPDAFFVDYQIGSSISSAVHPDGQIIHYAGDPDTYYVVMDGKRRMLTGSAIADNMLNTSFAEVTELSYSDGADVTGYEEDLGQVACLTAGPAVTGGVTVTLASDTPAGKTIPTLSSSNALIKVNLTTGDQAARVNGLHFRRVGTGAASDIANVYLYDGNGTRLTTGRTINSTTHLVEFNSLDLDVPANTTKSVYVYADIGDPITTGGEHAIQLTDAASVILEGTGSVSGNFAITGNTFTIGAVSVARVDVKKGVTPTNPTVGSKNVEVSNFKLTANTNDVEVRQITLYQAGSINNDDLTNIELVQGTDVVAEGTISSDSLITFQFNTPFVIGDGVTKVFKVMADVGGRKDRTIKTYVEYSTDITAIDSVYNSGALICINNTDTGCTTSGANFDGTGTNYIEVTTQGGSLTVSFNGPSTANVAKGTLGVVMHKFALTSEDNDLEVRRIRVSLDGIANGVDRIRGSAGTDYFRNIKIVNEDTGTTLMGPINLPTTLASSTQSGEMTFTDTFDLDAGQTLNLAVVADLSNSEDAANEFFGDGDNSYKVTLRAFQSNDIRVSGSNEYLEIEKIVPNSNIVGNPMTVKAASLTADLATDPTGTTIVKKQSSVPSVGITLTAGAQSDVKITSLKLTGKADQANTAGGYTAKEFAQLVTKVALFDGDTQIGDAISPDTETGEALISNLDVDIPAGSTKNLVAKVTVASTLSTTTSTDKYAIGVAAAGDITAQDDEANTVNAQISPDLVANSDATGQLVVLSVLNSGIITYQQSGHPQSTIVVGGGSAWQTVASFKATAQFESATIERLRVQHPNDGGKNSDFIMVAVSENGDTTNRWDILSAGTTGTKDIDLSANPIVVPKDSSVEFDLVAQFAAPVATSSATTLSPRSGDTPSLGMTTNTTSGEWNPNYTNQINILATGDASGERLYATSTSGLVGNAMVLRKGKPVVTKLSVDTTQLTSGGNMELLKFQVTPDADGGKIAWKQIIFKVTTSSSAGMSLNTFRLVKGSTELTPNTEVIIKDLTGADISGATNLSGNYVIVRLVNEEEPDTSGTRYVLKATVTYSGSNNSVKTGFLRAASVVTGYIADDGGISSYVGSLGIDTAVAPDGGSEADGTFLWSDQVDVPHSDASGTAGGSRDWTNDVYVEDLTQSQTLSE